MYNSLEGLNTHARYLSLEVAFNIAKERNLIVDFELTPINEKFVEYKNRWGIVEKDFTFLHLSQTYKFLWKIRQFINRQS